MEITITDVFNITYICDSENEQFGTEGKPRHFFLLERNNTAFLVRIAEYEKKLHLTHFCLCGLCNYQETKKVTVLKIKEHVDRLFAKNPERSPIYQVRGDYAKNNLGLSDKKVLPFMCDSFENLISQISPRLEMLEKVKEFFYGEIIKTIEEKS